jgi:DNA-binding LacI/PurR family transcriptional regulator
MPVSSSRRRVTSADVARESGVSRATVSYVLNGAANQSISPQTRRRVLDAARQLGYTPYAPARALRAGRSDVVLFLIPEWPIGAAIASLIEQLSLALAEKGLTLVVHAHPRSARPVSELWKAITPAALINNQALNAEEIEAAHRNGVAVITPVYRTDGPGTFTVFQQRIGRLQAEHLLDSGHRRLGFAFPDDDRLLAFAQPRLDGVRAVCAERGSGEPDVQIVALDAASGARAVAAWAALRPPVSGVCAYNDEVALAVLAGMRAQGLAAPADLAVIGVDDIPAAALATPALTTITTGMQALGRYLAAAVVRSLAGKPPPAAPGAGLIRLVRRESA